MDSENQPLLHLVYGCKRQQAGETEQGRLCKSVFVFALALQPKPIASESHFRTYNLLFLLLYGTESFFVSNNKVENGQSKEHVG
jgi:hypothetical protein